MSRIILILSCILFHSANTCAQTLNDPLNQEISVLNGRASFQFPDSAEKVARAVNLMSADRNEDRETRIIFNVGEERIVFFAQELFALGSKKLTEWLEDPDDQGYQFESEVLSKKKKLYAVLSTPTKFDSTQSAILINSLLVRTKDQCLFRIDAYINPSAYARKTEFTDFSEQVFGTLAAGDRLIPLEARTQEMPVLTTDYSLKFHIPENHTISVDQKYDFQVVYLHRFRPYEDSIWVNLTIYSGYYPSLHYKDYGFSAADATYIKSAFLGEEVGWLYFENRPYQVFLKEQLIPADHIANGMQFHVAMTSNSPRAIVELSQIVEQLELIYHEPLEIQDPTAEEEENLDEEPEHQEE